MNLSKIPGSQNNSINRGNSEKMQIFIENEQKFVESDESVYRGRLALRACNKFFQPQGIIF